MQIAKRHNGQSSGRVGALLPAVSVAALTLGVAGQQQLHGQATTINPGTATEAASSALAGELTASKVIQDPGAPYENLFKNFDVGLAAKPKVGAASVRLGIGPLDFNDSVGTPVERGFRPDSAELKIGNFYLDVMALTASMLYTDNKSLTENNRRDDVAAALSLELKALYQLNDGLRVGVQGSLIWLPLDNRAGVQGFGISDPFARFGLENGQLFSANVESSFTLGNWDILLYDYFRVENGSLYRLGDTGILDTYDGETFGSTEKFREQRLIYNQNSTGGTYIDRSRQPNSFQADALDYINIAGVVARRMLPTDLQATLGYYHENYWYSSASKALKTPTRFYNYQDTFYAQLQSQRENLRFKPYAYYRAEKDDTQTGWDQSVGGGIIGPITEQLMFQGEAGYSFTAAGLRDTETWSAALLHDAGPFTRHSIEWFRQRTDPADLVEQSLTYNLRQILGPYLRADLYLRRTAYEDQLNPANDSTEDLIAGTLTHDLGDYGQLQFLAMYRILDFENPATADYNLLTLRLIYGFDLGETVSGTVFYQFERKDSTAIGQDYYENLVALRVRKSF